MSLRGRFIYFIKGLFHIFSELCLVISVSDVLEFVQCVLIIYRSLREVKARVCYNWILRVI